ncbi:MAG TPA: MarR family transcriptional regulator [Jatrophihabitantaceae bacterium]
MTEQPDHVAAILQAWHTERPDLDVSPVAIFGRITRIDRYQAAAMRQVWRRHKIDSGEYDVLAALHRSGPDYQLTPTELYRSVLVTSATMTERLDRLQRRKLIRRRPATRDRRSVLVELTPRGRTVIDHAIADLLTIEADLLDGLSGQDRSTLAALLAKLAAILEQHHDTTAPGSA